MEQKVKTSYAWICVPADIVSAAITGCVLGNKNIPTWNIPVFRTAEESFENGALVDAMLAGLDIWYQLSEYDKPEDTMYCVKFLTQCGDNAAKYIKSTSLVDIKGEAYRLTMDLEDKWLASCRASALYGKESAASRMLTKEQIESCMTSHIELLKDEKLTEVLDQHEHIDTLELFSSKFIWKPFTTRFLTNTVCDEPGAQADISEYSDFISEYLRRLSNSIMLFGVKEQPGELKARVTLFGTSIAVPIYLDEVLRNTDTETVAKWLQGNTHAKVELLYNIAENNHKVALLMCMWSSIKTVIEYDQFAYEECVLRVEAPIPSICKWYAKYEPDEYASLLEYLKSDKDN